jgi:hypothetical protein
VAVAEVLLYDVRKSFRFQAHTQCVRGLLRVETVFLCQYRRSDEYRVMSVRQPRKKIVVRRARVARRQQSGSFVSEQRKCCEAQSSEAAEKQ